MTSALTAIEKVLRDAGEPLHYRDITKRMLDHGYWKAEGKTPAATVNARLSVAIKAKPDGRFMRTAPGIFTLRRSGAPAVPEPWHPANTDAPVLSFTNAAEHVLKQFAHGEPMHYAEITKKALHLGLIRTAGQTPHATMYAQILQECQRRERRGEPQRFDRRGEGLVGLAAWNPVGVEGQIVKHNESIKKLLRQRLHALKPAEFEALVGRLLTALGFDEVNVTRLSNDGGIDVRGVLVVGDAVRIRMAVQAKRWKQGHNIQKPTIQQVRGSLGPHEQGLVITTSKFSSGAIEEAERPNATPVALIDGDRLIGLLVEHQILVRRQPHDMLSLEDSVEGAPK